MIPDKDMRFLRERDFRIIKKWKENHGKVISEKFREKETSKRE